MYSKISVIGCGAGEATVASIYKEELVEKNLKMGDIYRIGAGNAFYLVNTGEGQRLHIICSIDKSYAIGWGSFQVHKESSLGSSPSKMIS